MNSSTCQTPPLVFTVILSIGPVDSPSIATKWKFGTGLFKRSVTRMSLNFKVDVVLCSTVYRTGLPPLGNMGYKGIGGKPVLYTVEHKTTSTLKFSDIRVTDRLNNPVPNFHFVAIDGESTGPIESITVKTNGGVWQVLEFIPDQSNRPDCIVLSKPEGEKSLKWNSGCVGI